MKKGKYFKRSGFEGIAYDILSDEDLDKMLEAITRLTRTARMNRLVRMPVETDEDYQMLGEMFPEDE